MKNKFTSLCITISFCFATLSAQSNAVYSIRNNSTSNLLTMQTIAEGESNNVYCVGMDYTNYYESFLMKMGDDGQLVWQKKLQSSFDSTYAFYNQIAFYNNEVYVLGTTYNSLFQLQYLIIKTDINGNLLWSKSLLPVGQGAYGNPGMSINQNSGIIVSGSTSESIDIFSLNPDGSNNWRRNFNTDSSASKNPNFDITVAEDGNIMGCCKAESDISFYCLGSDGTLKWAKRVLELDNNYTHVKSIIEINNNKFLICGYRSNMILGTYGGFYGFIDSLGSFLDFRLVNELWEIKTAIVLNNGNILLDAYNFNNSSSYLIIDDQGNIIAGYSSPFSGSSTSYNGITETSNYKYFADNFAIKKVNDFSSLECLNLVSQPITFTGDDPGSAPSSNYFMMHAPGTISDYPDKQLVTSDLQLEIACAVIGIEENNIASIHIFPTALNNGESIYVNSSLENTSLDYQIMDINGRMVIQQPLMENSIPINGLSTGMYIIQFAKNGNVVKSEKFVVVN